MNKLQERMAEDRRAGTTTNILRPKKKRKVKRIAEDVESTEYEAPTPPERGPVTIESEDPDRRYTKYKGDNPYGYKGKRYATAEDMEKAILDFKAGVKPKEAPKSKVYGKTITAYKRDPDNPGRTIEIKKVYDKDKGAWVEVEDEE